MPNILHVFYDVDHRCRQSGLLDHAKKEKIDLLKTMKEGEFAVFFNRRQDRVYILTFLNEEDSYGFLSQYRAPHGRVDPGMLQYLPAVFNGTRFNFDKAVKTSLVQRLRRQGHDVKVEE